MPDATVPSYAATVPSLVGPDPDAIRLLRRPGTQRVLRVAGKLARMGPLEVADRIRLLGRHQLRLLLDRAGFAPTASRTRRAFLRALSLADLGERLAARFAVAPSDREPFVALARARGWDEPIASACALFAGDVRLLGREVRLDGGAVRWTADLRSGVEWPCVPLREGEVGGFGADVRYVWELNRLQFLPALGRAYWLTDEPRWIETACAVIDDWIGANPYGRGVNWASSLEVGLRAIAWLWTLPFVLSWPGLERAFLERWMGSLAEHYAHLRSSLSLYTDPTNHLIGEATALWMLSVCLPELPRAERTAARTLAILTVEAERQVAPDGTSREQAFGYQRFVLEFYLQMMIVLARLGRAVPAPIRERVEAMLACFATVAADGHVPPIGDGDDGRALPALEVSPSDVRHLFAIGASLFRRADWKALAGPALSAAAWSLGPEAATALDRLATEPPRRSSRVLAAGGWCAFQADGLRLLFDAGEIGLRPSAAHGHADALAVTVSVDGHALLDDPGTGSYFEAEVRDALRGTAAHNTLGVDALDQADLSGPFHWLNLPRVELALRHLGRSYDYALASHTGYERLRAPVRHWRAVLFVRPSIWIIIDHVEGRGTHRFTRHFNCPPTVTVRRDDDGIAVRDGAGRVGLHLTFAESIRRPGPEPGRVVLHHDALWSSAYGSWGRDGRRVDVETTGEPPITFFTFLDPWRGEEPDPPRHATATADVAGAGAAFCRADETLVAFNPRRETLDLPGDLRTDAAFLYLRRSLAGDVTAAFVGGGGRCEAAGRTILACEAGACAALPAHGAAASA